MYTAIFYDRKTSIIHLWDDQKGYISFDYQPYAYKRKRGGKFKSIYGEDLEKITRFRYTDMGLYESDVPQETRCLIDGYGDSDEVSTGHRRVVIDIEVDSTGGYPNSDDPKQKITAIAIHESVGNKYYCFVLDEEGVVESKEDGDKVIISCPDEEDLLRKFLNKWEEISPTIVTGWNIDGFDFPYLYARLEFLFGEREANRLSSIGICYFNKFKRKMTIAGVNCLDYLLLYKIYSQKKLTNYRLDTVGKEELKVGKMEYSGSLDSLKKTDINKFIEYNLHDIVLVKKLDETLQFIDLAMSICHISHVGYEEFHVSSKFLEGALLTYLRRNNLVAPSKKTDRDDDYSPASADDEDEDGFEGAYVKEPIPGRYDWICSADINSLYPSVIMSINISPETKLGVIEGWNSEKLIHGSDECIYFKDEKYTYKEFSSIIVENNFSVSANGVVYDQKKEGCIPNILKKWFAERVEFKNKMKAASNAKDAEGTTFWKRRQQVQKILLNSLYGVVGMEGWRFYDKDNAEAVTITGQEIIKTSARFVNGKMNKRCGTEKVDYVTYIDTDSLYIDINSLAKKEGITDIKPFAIKSIEEIVDSINEFYTVMMVRMFNSTENRIKIAADVVAKAAFWTGKKRYAMWKVYNMELNKDVDQIEIKGLDVVRSSYPKKFRSFMESVLSDILKGTSKRDLDTKILDFKNQMKEFSVQDIAKNTSVRFVSNTESKTNFNPKDRAPFSFVSKSTAQCKASLAYNDMLKHFNLVGTEPIMSGGKVKWVYLKDNEFGLDGLAFKDDDKDPEFIMTFISKNIDRNRIWETELQSKLEDFYTALKWEIFNVNRAAIEEFFTF